MKTLTIIFSNRCNLDCTYCMVKDSLNQGPEITVEDAYKFIEWQVSLKPSDQYTIEFFGGEPTIHYEEIKALRGRVMHSMPHLDVSWRIYTNGVYGSRIRDDREFWLRFDDIIFSVDGEFDDNLERTDRLDVYTRIIANYQDLVSYAPHAGIAFVLSPGKDPERILEYFASMGCRYFTFELMTLVNDDKDAELTNSYILEVADVVSRYILQHNLEHPEAYRVFSVPRELLAGSSYDWKHNKSCFETMRSLSPSGNIYFCRDLAVGEVHLQKKSSEGVFFRSGVQIPFNIKALQLDKLTDSYSEDIKHYDELTACPVKSFEFIHLANMPNPPWIRHKDFQADVIRPLFDLMHLTFEFHKAGGQLDEAFMQNYAEYSDLFREIIWAYDTLDVEDLDG